MKSLVIDRVNDNHSLLGLTSSKEPLHMTTAVISPCNYCANFKCLRHNANDYEGISDDFKLVMSIRLRETAFSLATYRIFNPISYDSINLRGVVFAFVALPSKNLTIHEHKVKYTWEVDTTLINCEPYPVPCMFSLPHILHEYSGEVNQLDWVRILHTGEAVWNGVFIPTCMYGGVNSAAVASTIISDYEISEML
jgi:hypothetical protein